MKKITRSCPCRFFYTKFLFMLKKLSILFVLGALYSTAVFSQGDIVISANIAPPALPVYVQPACPYDGYIWTPGYWAYDNVIGYYWVPGVWVAPPSYGLYWTPCYWGYVGGVYGFHAGYWGPHVGFYGGVNYGYGYGGHGYGGGMWSGNSFRYNTAVSNVNTTVIHNTYVNRTVINNNSARTSFNGPGGVTAKPTQQEQSAMQEHHVQATSAQASHQQTASKDRNQFANVNHGKPATVAMDKPGGQHFNTTGKPANTPARQQPAQHSNVANNNNAQKTQQAHQQPQQSHQAARQPQAANHPQPTNRPQPMNRPAPPPRPQAPVNRPAAPPPHMEPPHEEHERR